MPELTYREQIDAARILKIRGIVRELPPACYDFMNSIAATTGTFTRLAYALDLRTFFQFLIAERAAFSGLKLYQFTDRELASVSQTDLTAYIDYLTLYYKADADQPDALDLSKPVVNHELAIKRKLCSLRSFYEFLFMNKRVPANVIQLVALPKIHEKPIIRLNDAEMEKILTIARDGDEQMSEHQKKYHALTARRDYAMLMLFLGTGIRVSELIGLNIEDFNM